MKILKQRNSVSIILAETDGSNRIIISYEKKRSKWNKFPAVFRKRLIQARVKRLQHIDGRTDPAAASGG